MTRRAPALLLSLAAFAAAGCGGEEKPAGSGAKESSGGGEASGGAAPDAVKIDIADFKYKPAAARVKAGGKVTWTNSDNAAHTASDNQDPPAFDTGGLDKGQSKAVTLEKPGRYRYICEFHPFMKGSVEVVK